jgi:hypothetical protein
MLLYFRIVQSAHQTRRPLFWRDLQRFALTLTYYEWNKSCMGYEFWKKLVPEAWPSGLTRGLASTHSLAAIQNTLEPDPSHHDRHPAGT